MQYILPFFLVLLFWWSSTAILLYRTGQSATTFRTTTIFVAVVAIAGALAIIASRDIVGASGAYLAFAGALAVWALLETTYLLGFITGPRPRACPDNVSTARRFWYGVQASLYHEIAVVATALAIAAATWHSQNKVGLYTFVVLWIMRWSTKLNIFLGVRNLHEEYWPTHLQYLRSYARVRSMNRLFPWSLVGALAAITLFALAAADDGANAAERTGAILLVSILVLATVEHVFLMFKVPDDMLWRVATRSRGSAG